MDYAIVQCGGRQYRVAEGEVVEVDKLDAGPGAEIELDKVLMISQGDDVKVGSPFVAGAKARLRVLVQGRGKRVLVFRYKAKKGVRRRQGHRQSYTRVLVERIEGGGEPDGS